MFDVDSRMLGTTMAVVGVVLLPSVAVMGAGQAVGVKHPVLKHDIDPAKAAEYEKAVERVMAMSVEQLLSFMPDRPYGRFCECPNCYGGVEGNEIFEWRIDRPEELKCKYCGTVVLPNADYREDQVMTGQNRLGETISYRYHYDQQQGVRHFLSGHLMNCKRRWLLKQCVALGKAHQATRLRAAAGGPPCTKEYARRVVLVLDRIATVYPHYPVMYKCIRKFRFAKSQDPPYPWNGGRWGFHSPANELPPYVVRFYDLVYDSPELDRLSRQRGYNVRERLENGFLRDTLAAVQACPKRRLMTNYVGFFGTAANLGRVLHDPRIVHWAFGWMKETLSAGCWYDGMWHESPSYHYMTMGGLKAAFRTVTGYSDPPGYLDAVDHTRFDALDPEKALPFFAKALHAPEVLDFPNGCSTPSDDSWANRRRSKPRSRTVSTILPGYGHASLGRGAGNDQIQAQLHYSGAWGHAHRDKLNLTLFAKGSELLSDIGYTWTQMRYWTSSTASHNTVVVDRTDQRGRIPYGDLRWFFPDSNGVSVAAADGKRAYSNVGGLDQYRRLLVLIPVSDADAYVVDIFRLHGGSTHDWMLHGSANEDMTGECSLPLAGQRKWMLEPDEKWEEPKIQYSKYNPYGMLRDMESASTAGSFTVVFRYVKQRDKGIRVHLLGGTETEVFLGRSPSVRGAGQGAQGDQRKVYDFWMPQLVLRRRGDAPLANTFVAVEEPFEGEPFIAAVERVELSPADEGCTALRVRHGDTVDTIISTLDEPPYPERATTDGVRIKGRLGVVRQVAGQAAGAWLFEGEMLAGGGGSLETDGSRYTGEITAAARKADGAEHDAFITNIELPVGGALGRTWMIVTHGNGYTHGYEIQRVHRRNGKTVIVLTHDHGLRIDGDRTKEVYFPHREINGKNEFVVPLAAAVGRALRNKGEQDGEE